MKSQIKKRPVQVYHAVHFGQYIQPDVQVWSMDECQWSCPRFIGINEKCRYRNKIEDVQLAMPFIIFNGWETCTVIAFFNNNFKNLKKEHNTIIELTWKSFLERSMPLTKGSTPGPSSAMAHVKD